MIVMFYLSFMCGLDSWVCVCHIGKLLQSLQVKFKLIIVFFGYVRGEVDCVK